MAVRTLEDYCLATIYQHLPILGELTSRLPVRLKNKLNDIKECCLYPPYNYRMFKLGYQRHSQTIVDTAVISGHINCLKYHIMNLGVILDSSLFTLAARHGRIDCLRWLFDNECEINIEDIQYESHEMIIAGYLECLDYLDSIGIVFRPDSIKTAIIYGDITMIKFIFKKVYQENISNIPLVILEDINRYTTSKSASDFIQSICLEPNQKTINLEI